ncbi:hypothetical protein ABPG77_006182 [Micractinium sp. CCAP 211/92]
MLRVVLASSGRVATLRAASHAQRVLATSAGIPARRSGLTDAAPQQQAAFSGTAATQLRAGRVACAAAYGNVDVKGASELMQGEGYAYADVRTAEEFGGGHAPGACNVPVMLKGPAGMSPNPEFVKQFEKAFPEKTAPIVVGCLSGKRSLMAAELLSAAGYTNLKNVEGGYQAWMGAGLPVETA